jgi:hypothetical protein
MGLLIPVCACGTGQDTADRPALTSACAEPGPEIRDRLPVLDRGVSTFAAPCVPFADLDGAVGEHLPAPDRATGAALDFLNKVRRVATRLGTDCRHAADRRAIRIYRHEDSPASVGVVAVVGTENAACFLLAAPDRDPGYPGPRYGTCLDTRVDQRFAVLAVASTERMCALLGAMA